MFNLSDPKISYIIVSPEIETNLPSDNNILCEKVCTILYAKGYTIIPVASYCEGRYEKSFISISSDNDNDVLRNDSIFLIEKFQQREIIVKYKEDTEATKIKFDGSEKFLHLTVYDSNLENKTYIHNGVSFSFVEKKRYFFPKRKEDLKSGMLVEYFNNNKWNTKEIVNIDSEYEKMFKLLIKYEKLRVECK